VEHDAVAIAERAIGVKAAGRPRSRLGWTSPSELAEYAFCPEAHYLRHEKGIDVDTAERRIGTQKHASWAAGMGASWAVRRFFIRLMWIFFIVGAAILGLTMLGGNL
jgi:hypothetical protein